MKFQGGGGENVNGCQSTWAMAGLKKYKKATDIDAVPDTKSTTNLLPNSYILLQITEANPNLRSYAARTYFSRDR
jgi:hypothetical protein